MTKRGVEMVTVSTKALKRAFRKTQPERTAQELHPLWLRFWAGIVLSAKVEMVKPTAEPGALADLLDDPTEDMAVVVEDADGKMEPL